jgi:hypothetical protein
MLPPQQEYIHHSIDSEDVKYKNRNYFRKEEKLVRNEGPVSENETLLLVGGSNERSDFISKSS